MLSGIGDFLRSRLPIYALAGGLIFLSLVGCGGKSAVVDKTTEDGVEVVLNHIEPYTVRDEPSQLRLEKDFIIDTENRDLLEKGFLDIRGLDVDSGGNVYLIQHPRNVEFLVFKFDGQGRFQRSLVRKGSGPGEVQWPFFFGIDSRDEVQIFDSGPGKLLTFSPSGVLLREVSYPQAPGRSIPLIPLANGNLLSSDTREEPPGASAQISLDISGPNYAKIRTFSSFEFISDPERAGKINAFTPMPMMAITPDRIHLGYPGQKYEILVYDLKGNLLRKIRKDYRPVAVTEAYRQAIMAGAPKGSPIVERIYFPDYKPGFQFLFADEYGRLLVMTCETDTATGQNICDIYNRDGVFIGRAALGYFDYLKALYGRSSLIVVAKHGRMHVVREKENGFKEVVVSKAIWR